jgi:hypothetical protein
VLYSHPCALFLRGYLYDTSLFSICEMYLCNTGPSFSEHVGACEDVLGWDGMGECKVRSGLSLPGCHRAHVRSSIRGTCIPLP